MNDRRRKGKVAMQTPTGNTTQPKHEEIAARAYQIWEASGRLSGSELKNWLQAERGLTSPGITKASSSPAKTSEKVPSQSNEKSETGNRKVGPAAASKGGPGRPLVTA